jgi:hypothetical protein
MALAQDTFSTAGGRIATLSVELALLLVIGGGLKLTSSQEIKYSQAELGRQPRRAGKFFQKYQDRIFPLEQAAIPRNR